MKYGVFDDGRPANSSNFLGNGFEEVDFVTESHIFDTLNEALAYAHCWVYPYGGGKENMKLGDNIFYSSNDNCKWIISIREINE